MSTTIETEKIDCPVCFGIEEDEPCDACRGHGYFLRRVYKPVPPFTQETWDAMPYHAQKVVAEAEERKK